jgi:hypothetical protein
MDEELEADWAAELNKYPRVVRDALVAAMGKAHELRRNKQQAPIKQTVIDKLREKICPEGLVNEDLVAELTAWEEPV